MTENQRVRKVNCDTP